MLRLASTWLEDRIGRDYSFIIFDEVYAHLFKLDFLTEPAFNCTKSLLGLVNPVSDLIVELKTELEFDLELVIFAFVPLAELMLADVGFFFCKHFLQGHLR